MTDAPHSIELEEFELVIAAPGTALLRVAARRPPGHAADSRPTLAIDDGDQVHRLAPLPAPPDPESLLRAAFRAPVALLVGDNAFTLELSGGAVLSLPPPVPRSGLRVHRGHNESLNVQEEQLDTHDQSLEPDDDFLVQAQEHEPAAGQTRQEARTNVDESAERQRAEDLESELGDAREQAVQAHVRMIELEAAALEANRGFVELQTDTERLLGRAGELEDTLEREAERAAEERSAAEKAVDVAEKAVEAANETAAAATSQASEARQRVEPLEQRNEELERRNEELEEAVGQHAARTGELERALSESEHVRSGLQQELSALTEARVRLEVSLARTRDEFRLITTERDELIRQVTAHAGVATKARDRGREAERARSKADRALADLQGAYADLEERLTQRASDLEAANAGRAKAERAVKQLQAGQSSGDVER